MMIATRQQITMIALAVLAVMSLRFLAGPFALQGVLYVLVTGVVTWRIGVRAGLMSAVLGVIAAHLQRVIVDPGVSTPLRIFDRQYAVGYSAYVLLSTLALLIGSRYQKTLSQLTTTRLEQQIARDRDHLTALQAALEREQSARHEAEDANREREVLVARLSRELDRVRQLAAIVESSDDMIVATDVAGIIQSWNRAAEQTFGIAAADAVGQSIHIIVPPDHREAELALQTTIERGGSRSLRRRNDDDRTAPCSGVAHHVSHPRCQEQARWSASRGSLGTRRCRCRPSATSRNCRLDCSPCCLPHSRSCARRRWKTLDRPSSRPRTI